MTHILHVCSTLDPAGDVYRAVGELNRVAGYQHHLVVREPHPLLSTMRLPEPTEFCTAYPAAEVERATAIICHFTGWPDDWPEPCRPIAFRNLNIRYSDVTDSFWAEPQFNCRLGDTRYKLLSASHVGAQEFLTWAPFRWLPDLLPMDTPDYLPSFLGRAPCVSYIKHAPELDGAFFGAHVKRLNMAYQPHASVLARRKNEATVVIDNVIYGHWGLAGHESISLGLPTVVFNHSKTLAALDELCYWQRFPDPVKRDYRHVGTKRKPHDDKTTLQDLALKKVNQDSICCFCQYLPYQDSGVASATSEIVAF